MNNEHIQRIPDTVEELLEAIDSKSPSDRLDSETGELHTDINTANIHDEDELLSLRVRDEVLSNDAYNILWQERKREKAKKRQAFYGGITTAVKNLFTHK